MIQTIIGSGNRFNDVGFLWFPISDPRMADGGEVIHREIALIAGIGVTRFLPAPNGQKEVEQLLTEALDRPPQLLGVEVVRWVADLARELQDVQLRRPFAKAFSEFLFSGNSGSLTEWQRLEQGEAAHFSNSALRENIAIVVTQPSIVIERSPPSAESLLSLLSKGSGVALGSYLGFHAAGEMPMLLFATVPGGMLICCTAAGLAEAIQMGLRERVMRWIINGKPTPGEPEELLKKIQTEMEQRASGPSQSGGAKA